MTDPSPADRPRKVVRKRQPSADPRQSSWDLWDLMQARFPEPQWIVPDLIPEGLTLLVGAPKVGKSWFLLDVGIEAAFGGVFGGRDVAACSVLYLALEDPSGRLRDRAQLLVRDRPRPAGTRFQVERVWPQGTEGFTKLERTLAGGKYGLVLVDTLQRFSGVSTGKNAYADAYEQVGKLRELTDRAGAQMIVSHHDRKMPANDWMQTASGPQSVTGAADTILLLRRPGRSVDGTLNVTGRDVADAEYPVKFDEGQWTMLDPQDLLSGIRRQIIGHLTQHPGQTPAEISKALNQPSGTIRQRLLKMTEAGEVIREDGAYSVPTDPTATVIPMRRP